MEQQEKKALRHRIIYYTYITPTCCFFSRVSEGVCAMKRVHRLMQKWFANYCSETDRLERQEHERVETHGSRTLLLTLSIISAIALIIMLL